jgi:5'-3' exonuclease
MKYTMGIKSNYTKFLRQIAGDDIFEPTHISHFAFERVAIDTTLYLYKFKAAMGVQWISGFLNLIKCLRKNIVHPVFIFDGKAPIQKQEEQQSRKDNMKKLENSILQLEDDIITYNETGVISEKIMKLSTSGEEFNISEVEERMLKKHDQVIHVTPEDFVKLKQLFDIMEIPYYTAPSEAEKMCSKLCIDGKVAAALSDDTDVIAYKCPKTICKINTSSGGCFVVNHVTLVEKLKLNKQQFLDHCIMCGTDYNKNIQGVGSMTAYKHIISYGNIEGVSINTNLDVTILDHLTVRKLFTEFEEYNLDSIPFCGSPDDKLLERFFHENDISIDLCYYLSGLENTHIILE